MIIMHIYQNCHYRGIMIQVLLHSCFFCFLSKFYLVCLQDSRIQLFIELVLIVRTVLCDCLNIWFSISLQNVWVIF